MSNTQEYLKGIEDGRKEILTQIAEKINSGHITQLSIYNDYLMFLKEPVRKTWKKFSEEKPEVGCFILVRWRTRDFDPWVYTTGYVELYNYYQLAETKSCLCLKFYRAFAREADRLKLDSYYEWQEVQE